MVTTPTQTPRQLRGSLELSPTHGSLGGRKMRGWWVSVTPGVRKKGAYDPPETDGCQIYVHKHLPNAYVDPGFTPWASPCIPVGARGALPLVSDQTPQIITAQAPEHLSSPSQSTVTGPVPTIYLFASKLSLISQRGCRNPSVFLTLCTDHAQYLGPWIVYSLFHLLLLLFGTLLSQLWVDSPSPLAPRI